MYYYQEQLNIIIIPYEVCSVIFIVLSQDKGYNFNQIGPNSEYKVYIHNP